MKKRKYALEPKETEAPKFPKLKLVNYCSLLSQAPHLSEGNNTQDSHKYQN